MTSLFLNCHLLYIKRPRFHPHELPTTSPSPSLTPMAELPEVANGCDHELTKDGTVDLKGRPCFRSRGGRWKACSYIVGKPSSNFISSVRIFRILSYNNISIRTSITLCLVFYRIWSVWKNGILWDWSKSSVVSHHKAAWKHCFICKQCHRLGWNCVDDTDHRRIHRRCFSWSLLDFRLLFNHLSHGTHLFRIVFYNFLYWIFTIASSLIQGMILLTLTVSIPSLRPPKCGNEQNECDIHASKFQVGIFYCALYIIAIGTGGTKPNISTMGADQFDDFHPKERSQKLSFFNWWMFSIFFGTLFANSILVYIQDHVGFAVGYALPTFGLMFSVLVFLIGTPYYRHKLPSGSPFTKIAAVLVAAIRKSNVPIPDDPNELHELHDKEYARLGKFRISSTPSLRYEFSHSSYN